MYREEHPERARAARDKYRFSHREIVIERTRRWREQNQDKIAAYVAARYAERRDELAAASREYYHANRIERQAVSKAWKEAHKDEVRDYKRRYNRANPERVRAWIARRDALREGATGDHTHGDIKAQYARQRGRCYWCRTKVRGSYHVDHVVPLSRGGSNGPENIVIACPTCNMQKHAKHPMDWAGVMC
jgi:5-methylcytosine-specific restriction endonuclease McrA